jgi:nitrogenase subunit NifH
MNLVSGIDPSELSLSQLKQTYLELDPINHAHLVHVVCGRYNLPKKDKMAFLVDVLRTSNSLTARYYAADFFLKAAADSQLKWQPFQIDPLLSWWEQYSDTIE